MTLKAAATLDGFIADGGAARRRAPVWITGPEARRGGARAARGARRDPGRRRDGARRRPAPDGAPAGAGAAPPAARTAAGGAGRARCRCRRARRCCDAARRRRRWSSARAAPSRDARGRSSAPGPRSCCCRPRGRLRSARAGALAGATSSRCWSRAAPAIARRLHRRRPGRSGRALPGAQAAGRRRPRRRGPRSAGGAARCALGPLAVAAVGRRSAAHGRRRSRAERPAVQPRCLSACCGLPTASCSPESSRPRARSSRSRRSRSPSEPRPALTVVDRRCDSSRRCRWAPASPSTASA